MNARTLGAALAAVWLLMAAPASSQPTSQLKTMAQAGDITANGGAVTMANTAGMASLLIQTEGTFGTLTWELQCSGDGVTFDTDDEIPITLVSSSPAPVDEITSANTTALYTATISGCRGVRVIATAFTSGSMHVTLTAIMTGGAGTGVRTTDASGRQINVVGCTMANRVRGMATITDGASTTVVLAQGAGQVTEIYAVEIANTSAVDVTVDIRDGVGGPVLWTLMAPATADTGGGNNRLFVVPLTFTANTPVAADPSAAAVSVIVSAIGCTVR